MITTDPTQSKRLKELGAPQDTYFVYVEGTETALPNSILYNLDQIICHAYTLGELIEWLGDHFGGMGWQKTAQGEKEFIARESLVSWIKHEGSDQKEGFGATPLDAVVALAEAVKGGR